MCKVDFVTANWITVTWGRTQCGLLSTMWWSLEFLKGSRSYWAVEGLKSSEECLVPVVSCLIPLLQLPLDWTPSTLQHGRPSSSSKHDCYPLGLLNCAQVCSQLIDQRLVVLWCTLRIFHGGGREWMRCADLEAVYTLSLILKIMLHKSCRTYYCNITLFTTAFIYVQINTCSVIR